MVVRSVAFVGVVGGAGTTRGVLEVGGVVARAGRRALVFDLDFATQGCSQYLDGRIEEDAATVVADSTVDLTEAIHDVPVDGSGRLGVLPSFAPLATLADAKSPDAGERVGDRLEEATEAFDHVLLDVPPVVSNQAIGAVTASDRVVAVISPTQRGVDSLPRERGRLADVGREVDFVLAGGDSPEKMPEDADAKIPPLPGNADEYRPATLDTSGGFTEAVGRIAESIFEISILEELDTGENVVGSIRRRFR